jgi:hypothetical protein
MFLADYKLIREPLLLTTEAHSSINAPSRKRDVHRFRVAFFGVPAVGWVLFWRSKKKEE